MDKSQLRKLAQEFARGVLEEDEFQESRAKLIDDIASGSVSIVREPSLRPKARPYPTVESEPGPAERGLKPVYVIVGLVVLGFLVWLVYPRQAENPSIITVTKTVEPSAVRAPGPGERLIEEFLQANNWTQPNLLQFETAWSALTDIERKETHQSGDFSRLERAIRHELNVQQALVSLDDSALARETGIRIHQFAEQFRFSGELPSFDEVATSKAPSAEQVASLAPENEADASPAPESIASSPASPTATVEPIANDWLGKQPVNRYTLQLFALDNKENVISVLARHADLDLKVLSFGGTQPKYRIVFGSFSDQSEAGHAYWDLPATLRQGQAEPVIKPIRELRQAVAP